MVGEKKRKTHLIKHEPKNSVMKDERQNVSETGGSGRRGEQGRK